MSRTVTIFGSGAARPASVQCRLAERLGRALSQRGFRICNGGYGGTMEAAARGAREAGGRTVGVTLKGGRSKPNPWLDEILPQPDLPTRILTLFELGDGYVVLGGSTGTLAEVGLLLEFQNKGLMPARPVVFLGGFWQPLLDLMAGEGILREPGPFQMVEGVEMRGTIAFTDSAEAAAEFLAANLASD